jgi:acid phosphatase (class A)
MHPKILRPILVWPLWLFALSVLSAPGKDHTSLSYLREGKVSASAILPPPPLPGSPEQAADMDTVRTVSKAASSEDVVAANLETNVSVFIFAPAVGSFFSKQNLPVTASFFSRVVDDTEAIEDGGKEFFHRPRPCTTDPSLASGNLEKSFSYPSGHSTGFTVLALVLADLFPTQRDAILAQARQIGWHRVQIARHYPTDIYAGRVLAQAIVREMKENPRFLSDFAAVEKEIEKAQLAAKN